MKLFAPEYYKDFKCIASRCSNSCCIGWEIDIDSRSVEKYKRLTGGYADAVRGSIEEGDPPHFRLASDERCPHLDSDGLCRIITELSEDCLCDICREHPRFYVDTAYAKEVGVGIACEEACRILLNSDAYDSFVEIGECDGDPELKEFDTLPHRTRIYGILKDKSTPYAERLSKISSIYGVSPGDTQDGEWRELISSLEYLDENSRSRFLCYSSKTDVNAELEIFLERLFAYFVFRHCTPSETYVDFRLSLGVALFLERLVASVAQSENAFDLSSLSSIAITVSEELEYSEDNTEAIGFSFL